MRIIPFHIWLITFAATMALYFFLPALHLILVSILVIHCIIFGLGVYMIRMQFFCPSYCSASRRSNTIALTFDDGPDPNLTPDLIGILDKYDIQATFFVIGQQARTNPALLKQCFDAGHTIACHDLTHSIFSNFRMTKQLVRDISASQGIIKDSIGKKPLLYRPPVGLTNPHTFSAIKKLGMTCIGWNMRAGDAGNRRLSGIKKISSLAKPGAVVMVHDCLPVPQYKADILEQVEKICISIREQKLSAIHIGEMFTVPVYE